MEFEELMEGMDFQNPFFEKIFSTSNSKKLTISQNELIKFIHENRFTIIYKKRQAGVSTVVSIYMLWLLINNPEYSIGVMFSNNHEREIFRQMINMNLSKLGNFFNENGMKMKLTPENHNIHRTSFPNGSSIKYIIRSANAFRGEMFNLIHLSELTLRDNFMDLFSSLSPCLSGRKNSRFLITTTELRNLKEDFLMNGDDVFEYWCNDFFDGKRFVIVEKTKKAIMYGF